MRRTILSGFIAGFWGCLFALSLLGWTYTYDCDTPLGTDSPATIDDRIREVKDSLQERLAIDHKFSLTGTEVSDADTGKHLKVTFQTPLSADPTAIDADEAQLYTKDVSSKAELFWIDEDENALQLVSGGTLNITSADLLGTVANNTYFTAVDAAGTGTVSLIKANASDVAVIPDGSELASSGAPTADADIANKKYVDDHTTMVPAVSGAGTGYAAEESVTLANGLIIKHGKATGLASGSEAITFGTAFPNSCSNVQVTITESSIPYAPQAVSVSTTGFTLRQYSNLDCYWMAIGY